MTRADVSADEFDYVVVGAGTAGALLASRLAQKGNASVCLLEAGPKDRHPFIKIPAGFIRILSNSRYTWQFDTEPTDETGGRKIRVVQGKTLGGSSSINGMVFNRCLPADYNQWAQLGNTGWSYADVLPYFKRIERRIGGGDDTFRGRSGEVPVTDIDWRHPLCEAFIHGATEIGIARNPDYNGASHSGVGYVQRNIYRGLRQSSARVFLRKAAIGRNLDVRTNARATRITFSGRCATGVRYVDGSARDSERMVRARREVILCSGAANTPKLLQLSGVGDAEFLAGRGIEVVHHLPGVGEGLRDHYAARVVCRVKNSSTMNEMARGLPLLRQIARWALGKPSILALSPALVYIFTRSDQSADEEDLHGAFAPASYRDGFVAQLDTFPGMTCGFYQQRPQSVGYVRVRSADPFVDPEIQPNYLAHDVDKRAMVAGIRLARRLLTTPPLLPFFDGEQLPGPDATTDADLLDFAKQYGGTAYHLIGTCRMGPSSDASSVVDAELRVHGLTSLRVVDASIMPTMPSGNTAVPTLMIAEKAADMIDQSAAAAAPRPAT